MNITDALKNVKEAALEGRKLEAWCEEDPAFVYRFNIESNLFCKYQRIGAANYFWYSDVEGDGIPWGTFQVLGTWHVREVQDG